MVNWLLIKLLPKNRNFPLVDMETNLALCRIVSDNFLIVVRLSYLYHHSSWDPHKQSFAQKLITYFAPIFEF